MDILELRLLPDAEKAKVFAARHALKSVKSGMKIGIGTGSTAAWFVHLLAGAQDRGLKFRACATSSETETLAEGLDVNIEYLNAFVPPRKPHSLDLAIDGADEFDPDYNLIKGGGGALLQEKIVARAAKKFIVITDESKAVKNLGKFPLPIEVVKFGWEATQKRIKKVLVQGVLKGNTGRFKITQRMAGDRPLITDEGNYILDLSIGLIRNPKDLETDLKAITGVVETGLFIGIASEVVMADSSGLVKSRKVGGDWEETQYDLEKLAVLFRKF